MWTNKLTNLKSIKINDGNLCDGVIMSKQTKQKIMKNNKKHILALTNLAI